MRISDWSSDVCSSDLRSNLAQGQHGRLVVVLCVVDLRLDAVGELARALGGPHHEFEAVVDHFQAIFHGNAGHNTPGGRSGRRFKGQRTGHSTGSGAGGTSVGSGTPALAGRSAPAIPWERLQTRAFVFIGARSSRLDPPPPGRRAPPPPPPAPPQAPPGAAPRPPPPARARRRTGNP